MHFSSKPLSFFVIEDNDGDFFLVEAYLRRTNLEVENIWRAETVAQATLFTRRPDIIFLDLSLPDSTGLETFHKINEIFGQVPIVILSGLEDEALAVQCISLGAQDYLFKNNISETLLEKSVQFSIERKKNLGAIAGLNQRYELIGEITNEILWIWDIQTNEIETPKSSFLGYETNEIDKAFDWWIDKVHPDDKHRMGMAVQKLIDRVGANFHEEYRLRAKDNSYRHVFARAMLKDNGHSAATKVIGSIMDVTDTRRLQEEWHTAQLQFQKQLMEANINGQEKEKEKIGKELHDNINQVLTSVKLYLETAIYNEGMRELLLDKSLQNTVYAIDQIRQLSHSLIPPALGDYGLEDAIRELLEGLNETGLFQAHLQIGDTLYEEYLECNKKIMLYRIVQEQLSNIIKYAKAQEVFVKFESVGSQLTLTILDNGIGFDTTKKAKGVGLKNIESRAAFYGGTAKIISAEGQGTSLIVELPLDTPSV